MKNTKQIQTEINTINNMDFRRLDEKECSQLEARLKFLKTCLYYMKDNLRKEFIEKEKDRIEKILKRIEDDFGVWLKNTPPVVYGFDENKARPYWNKIMEKTKHNRHLKAINYLLEK